MRSASERWTCQQWRSRTMWCSRYDVLRYLPSACLSVPCLSLVVQLLLRVALSCRPVPSPARRWCCLLLPVECMWSSNTAQGTQAGNKHTAEDNITQQQEQNKKQLAAWKGRGGDGHSSSRSDTMNGVRYACVCVCCGCALFVCLLLVCLVCCVLGQLRL